jgi:hypothetical protein
MDDVSRLLLKMFSLPLAASGSVAVSSPFLVLLPIKELVNDILPGVLTSGQIDEIAQLGEQIIASRTDIPTSLHQMRRVSEIVYDGLNTVDYEQQGSASRRALDKSRLESIEQAFDFLLTLNYALNSRSIISIELQAAKIAFFRYVESLRIETNTGDPLVALVGPLPHSLESSAVQAALSDDQCPIIRDTEIVYHSNNLLPHLNVRGRCRWARGKKRRLNLDNWPQKPFHDGELDVFTVAEKRIGQVITRHVSRPLTIDGKYLQLTIPEPSDISVYETCLYDHTGLLRARSLRLFQSGGDPGPDTMRLFQ